MSHAVVSFTRFCEWVQGRKPARESDHGRSTLVTFEDGTEAAFYSSFDMRFGERSIEPPMITIKEKTP
jgi:hypothetical protein